DHQGGVQGRRGARRTLLRLGPRAAEVRHRELAVRRRGHAQRRRRAREGLRPDEGPRRARRAREAAARRAAVGGSLAHASALRGHASIQGSTDIPTLYDILPGYLTMPHVAAYKGLQDYIEANKSPGGWWGKIDTYIVSLLKAWWGEKATPENEFCFDYLPRIDEDNGIYRCVLEMLDGNVEGFLVVGENPAVGSAHSKLHRLAMAKLKWLVVRDLVEIESASFWKDGPEIETGELKTGEIATEVFFLPASSHV